MTAQLVLLASAALAVAGAGVYAAPHASAFLDACEGADADVDARATAHARKHAKAEARSHAKAQAAARALCDDDSFWSQDAAEDIDEDCEKTKASQRRARDGGSGSGAEASVSFDASVQL